MKARHALLLLLAITLVYIVALVWADSRNRVFSALPRLLATLPLLAGLSLLSYVLRYARWYWLLARAGHRTAVLKGFLAYLAGFAFTATPGKVGELLRIRYLVPEGVPAACVFGALVYERAMDLCVVLALAALAITRPDFFWLSMSFVVVVITILVVLSSSSGPLTRVERMLSSRRLDRVALAARTLRDGLLAARRWINPLDGAISLVFGVCAWCLTAAAFVLLLQRIGVSMPLLPAFATYPLGMLAGAASMLPGGIGSTEAALVVVLLSFDVSLANATLAAVGIRLATLWFAILCGLVAVAMLEIARSRSGPVTR